MTSSTRDVVPLSWKKRGSDLIGATLRTQPACVSSALLEVAAQSLGSPTCINAYQYLHMHDAVTHMRIVKIGKLIRVSSSSVLGPAARSQSSRDLP